MSLFSAIDTVIGSLTGALERNKANPFQALADHFGAYTGSAQVVGARVTPDGAIDSVDFPNVQAANAWMMTMAPASLYIAVWDRATNSISDQGVVTSEVIQVKGKAPPQKTSVWLYILLAVGGGYAYYHYSKKR